MGGRRFVVLFVLICVSVLVHFVVLLLVFFSVYISHRRLLLRYATNYLTMHGRRPKRYNASLRQVRCCRIYTSPHRSSVIQALLPTHFHFSAGDSSVSSPSRKCESRLGYTPCRSCVLSPARLQPLLIVPA